MGQQTKLIHLFLPNQTLYFTLYDINLTLNGRTYLADHVTAPIKINHRSDLKPDQANISLIDYHDHNFHGAHIEIYHYDIDAQHIRDPADFIGKISDMHRQDHYVTLTAYCQKNSLSQHILRNFHPVCQAIWGDTRCKINKNNYAQNIEITQIEAERITYTVLSGDINQFHAPYLQDLLGNIVSIFEHDPSQKIFHIEPHISIEIGQTYTLYAGCAKTRAHCAAYQNFDNFLGF